VPPSLVLILSRSSVNKICGASLNSGRGAFENTVNIVWCHELGTAFVNNMTIFSAHVFNVLFSWVFYCSGVCFLTAVVLQSLTCEG